MANQESVVGLLYSVKDEISLEITEYEWPKKLQLNYFDFAVSFTCLGYKVTGRGLDQNESVAMEKAASEALEKLICHTNKVDSVGLSVGIGYDCEAHAKFEALERYYLNEHLLFKIKLSQHNFSSDLIRDFRKNNPEIGIQFLKMNTMSDHYGIICILKSKDTRSVGFSFSNSEAVSIEKAFIEALPNLVHLANDKNSQIDKPWHLQDVFIDELEALMHKNEGIASVSEPTLEKIELNLKSIPFLKNINLKVSKYLVQNRQGIFWPQ